MHGQIEIAWDKKWTLPKLAQTWQCCRSRVPEQIS